MNKKTMTKINNTLWVVIGALIAALVLSAESIVTTICVSTAMVAALVTKDILFKSVYPQDEDPKGEA